MGLKQTIDSDLKTAMLSGDKELVSVYRGLKSVILDKEVSLGKRDEGLSDDEVIAVLQKESKKRQETANIYREAGETDREEKELDEKRIIDSYLPKMLNDEAILKIINEVISEDGYQVEQNQGKIIGAVIQRTNGLADGSVVSKLVRERLTQ